MRRKRVVWREDLDEARLEVSRLTKRYPGSEWTIVRAVSYGVLAIDGNTGQGPGQAGSVGRTPPRNRGDTTLE